MEQLVHITIVSFLMANVVWTLEMITQPGQMLEGYGKWLEREYANGNWWVKPLGYCAPCTTFWLCVVVSVGLWLDNSIAGSYAVAMPLIGLFWIRRVLV